ncbi:hypothetical protein N9I81_04440, partial [Planktomarina temperata]|nr:hypothetical protein [Planktomarina temperata]
MFQARARRSAAHIAMCQERHIHPIGQHIKHGNFQINAPPRAPPLDQGAQNGRKGSQTCRKICQGQAHTRRAFCAAGHRT